jgi:hypothetical protein
MPHTASSTCANCGGFPIVQVTTGKRLPNGSRQTTPVACRACHPHTHLTTRVGDLLLRLGVA